MEEEKQDIKQEQELEQILEPERCIFYGSNNFESCKRGDSLCDGYSCK